MVNASFVFRFADGELEQLPTLARELVAAKGPGGNLTGISMVLDALMGKRMELLTQAGGGIERIAYLGACELKTVNLVRATAKALNKELIEINALQDASLNLPKSIAQGKRADAWLVDDYPQFRSAALKIEVYTPAVGGTDGLARIRAAESVAIQVHTTAAIDVSKIPDSRSGCRPMSGQRHQSNRRRDSAQREQKRITRRYWGLSRPLMHGDALNQQQGCKRMLRDCAGQHHRPATGHAVDC